jgi:hypothetical protein
MEASMTLVRIFLMLAAAAAFVPMAASADPYSDLSRSFAAFNAARSWHATEQMSTGQTILVDHVAPDRWRIQPTSNMTEVLIGDQVYMNGRAIPMVGGMIHSRLSSFQMPSSSDFRNTLKDLGWQSVNGVRAHAYSYTVQGVPETLYVGTNHLPLQAIVKTSQGTMTITYSQYNAPITIAP